ncbi:MAG: response regulator transcription factor [Nitrospirota bacterium]|nr:response regulator transcription factor [Nitrospirota bacterium]
MKVLVVEDDKRLALLIKKGLEEHSFSVDVAFDGEEGLYMAETFPHDALILDVMLPLKDGFSVLAELRAQGVTVPVIMLTARTEVQDRVKGLNTGADVYLAKPFDFAELLARLKAAIRRSKGRPSPQLALGDLVIETNSRTVRRGDRDIRLSSKEYDLLEYLALNSGRVISRTELVEHMYDTDSERDSNVIDVYVNYLRNKVDKGFRVQLIRTVRGAGYMLRAATE